MPSAIPKLRTDLEIIPANYRGQQTLIIRDFLGLIQKPILLQGEALNLIGFLDGRSTIQDIQLALVRQRGGVFVSSESIENLLAELDLAFLLDSPRYSQAKNRLIAEYTKLPVRKASHAGLSYPHDPEKLRRYLKSILELTEKTASEKLGKKVCALIAPHIDLEAGKGVYSRAYQVLQDSSPKHIVLLGTGHNIEGAFLSLTEKDFETPLGVVKTDKNWVRKLKRAGEKVVAPHDLAHRQEHSLEFQLIFLQYLYGNDFSLVPVLCSSFQRELEQVRRPSEIPGVDGFLAALKESLGGWNEDILVVAGVDFSHIGPKFGHSQRAASLLLEAKKHDQVLIEACTKGDVEAFWAESKRVKDYYNVCGFSSLACLLEILPRAQGVLLDYEFSQEEPTQSAVSFAAIAFTK
jgi:AmmeMemoRadiSam system protein B